MSTESIDGWFRDLNERRLTRLRRWSALMDVVAPQSELGLGEAMLLLLRGEVPYLHAEAAFDRGFYESILRRRLDDESLDAFDGPLHDASVRAFGRASALLRTIAPTILGADMIDARGFTGNVSIGAVGELKRELTRTRGGKPIRRLMMDHWHVITKLTPCILASPDSAVAISRRQSGTV